MIPNDATHFIGQLRRWRTYTPADIDTAANGIILAADGKISRADAKMYARGALDQMGFEPAHQVRHGG